MKVVCFDLGGVLVRITLDMARAAADAGVGIDHSNPGSFLDFAPFLDFQAGRLASEPYAIELAKWLGCAPSESLMVHNHILLDSYPGTHELVCGVGQLGMLTACLSNTNEPHWIEMRQTDRFPNVRDLALGVASHEVRLEKPHAEIYERFRTLASERLGDEVDPAEILFFDDTLPNVRAAQSLGWNAVHIDPTGDTAAQMLSSLAELVPRFGSR